MAFTNWEIYGPFFGNCNCNTGCPCQFNSLPTHGNCCAISGLSIERGHFGDVPLAGLNCAITYKWPGAVHEGEGTMQAIIDENADEKQRDALCKILHGEETPEGSSVFQVFAMTSPNKLDPVYTKVDFTCNVEERSATLTVPGIIEQVGEPIRNATTGEAQEVKVSMPGGFEFTEANFGCGTAKATGDIKLDFDKTHGHFCYYHFNQDGIIR